VSGLEGVALTLGAAVVKSACKVWLGDRSIAADASASAVDLVAVRAGGVVERRRVRRLFEQMEEVVAERLRPLLEHEFRSLPENERLAAIDAVRATFDRAALTDEDLFAADLDAGYVDRYLRRVDPEAAARSFLSGDATAFYDLLLRECCAHLVQIITTLPEFQPGVLTELLRRDSEILGVLRELLARFPERRGPRDFEMDYRQQIATALDRMTFFGAALSEPGRRSPLSVAYVSLALAAGDLAGPAGGDGPLAEERSWSLASSLRVEEILPLASRLFVRGEAGSGKTTLLQWLAVRCAYRELPAAGWGEVVPFFVRLRRYADQPLPAPEQFLADVGRHIADEMPSGWVHHQLRTGRAAVLIDGVDELPEHRRNEARGWLRELVAAFPAARYAVTSRPAAAPRSWLREEGFTVADLQPMSPAGVRAFVHRWHEAIRAASADEERGELDSYESRLSQAITIRRALRRIAENPLLCALLCALHRDRRGQLPQSRMELYEVTLHLLLERRDKERGIDPPPGLSRTEKTLLLQDLAYWLLRNGWSDAPTGRVAERIAAKLSAMPHVRAAPEEVFRHLLERSGLLREPVTGRIDFVHRTFQEYLAAEAAVAADDIGVLIENAHLDQWREAVVMAAGHASRRQREELLTGLIRHDSTSRRQRAYLNLLAMACLETSPELDQELRAEIESRVRRLLPPRNMSAAAAVAAAGDFVLDLLATSQPQSAQQTAATIRAAAEIGGDAARQLIARFGDDRRKAVVKELVGAWPRFDAVGYADAVLRDSPLLPHGPERGALAIDDPLLIPALNQLRFLRHLECRFSQGHGDLGFLAQLPELSTLLVADPALSDLSPLRHTRLTRLLAVPAPSTPGTPLDLAPLGEVPTLTRLDLLIPSRGWHHLTELPQLSGLQLAGIEDAARLEQLKGLPALDIVGLRDVAGLADLSPLGFLHGPRWLGLHNCPSLTDLHGLTRWANTLQRLWLKDCGAADFTPLSDLRELDFLYLSGRAPADLSILSGLHRLETLRLTALSSPPDLAPLRDLPRLRRMWLYGNGDCDLTPLRGKPGVAIYAGRDQELLGADLLGPGSMINRR
jgi:hypothetical protein